MADVFLSYSKQDRSLAEKVVRGLESRGFTVWWDDQLTPHTGWDRTIERELANARSVVVLWTRSSVDSDFVRAEAMHAKDNGNKLLQAKCGPCTIPLAFTLLQHTDISDWPTDAPHVAWEKLVGWVSSSVGAAPEARKALEKIRHHFMEITGDGISAYNSINLHTPIAEMLDDFNTADQFADLASTFCVDAGVHRKRKMKMTTGSGPTCTICTRLTGVN